MTRLTVLSFLAATALSLPAFAEPQPHMKAALKDLEQAKAQLEKATPDKGGHRVKALELTNQAIEEVKKGLAFDNKH